MSLTAEQHRALALLTNDPRGVTEALMQAHGFSRDMLAGLVLAGLATVTTERMRAGVTTIRVEKYRITETGQQGAHGRLD